MKWSENRDVTIPVAAIIGVTERSIERNIHKLQAQGLLCRIGPAKGGHWESTSINVEKTNFES